MCVTVTVGLGNFQLGRLFLLCHVIVLLCTCSNDTCDTLLSPISDATLTTGDAAEVMELINDWGSLQRGTFIEPGIIPSSRFRAIRDIYSTKSETANECASYYIHCHPLASWIHLVNHLYHWEETAAVEKLKPFLPLRGNLRCNMHAGTAFH